MMKSAYRFRFNGAELVTVVVWKIYLKSDIFTEALTPEMVMKIFFLQLYSLIA